jgi:hypothetical protein
MMNALRRSIAPVIAVGIACGGVAWVVAENPRLLASWHGWLHVAIAEQLPSPTLVPENPFFAGEWLPYYWVYHLLGRLVANAFRINALPAFHLIALASLAGLILAAIAAGRGLYRSTAAGITIAVLAVIGLNPFGPEIAIAKYFAHGQPLAGYGETTQPPQAAVDVFVSNQDADRMMARPLLGAMYFSTDWRAGQNVVWFFDVSARAPALAFLLCVAWLFADGRWSSVRLLALVLASAAVAALNPLMGLAIAVSLGAVTVLSGITRESGARALAVAAGVAIAAPTYAHLLGAGGSTISSPHWIVVKAVAAVASFVVLLPLAFMRSWLADEETGRRVRALAWTGLVLLLATVAFGLPEGNEHNLANAAACVLAVPAAAWVSRRGSGLAQAMRAAFIAAIFAPVTVCTFHAFTARDPLPLRIQDGRLHRRPVDGAINAFYEWARTTPADAAFVTDPDRALKMSGNVSEIPAFTGRVLFVDQISYLTAPFRDRERRENMARQLLRGDAIGAADQTYLNEFRRPMFLVSVTPEDPGRGKALAARFGPPIFAKDFVAVFALTRGR